MIIKSPYNAIDIPVQSLLDYLFEQATTAADKTALVDGLSGYSLSYAELRRRIDRFAAGLQARGLGKGDVLAIYSPNQPDYATAFLGAARAGVVITTVNPLYTAGELRHQLNDAGARLLLTVAEFDCLQRAQEAISDSGTAVEQIAVFTNGKTDTDLGDGLLSFEQLLGDASAFTPVALDAHKDLIVLPYSSGTTGLPKGVMLNHYNLVANLEQIDRADLGSSAVDHDSMVIGVLPFFHIYGMVVIMLHALAKGATIVTMARFDLQQFLQIIDDYQISVVRIVPPIVLALGKHPLVEQYRLDSIKSIFSGAAPLGGEQAAELRRRLPNCRVSQGYGMTELSPVSHMNPDGPDDIDLASIGPGLANTECAIADLQSGEFLGPNQEGELWVRGPQVMQGYLNNPEATAATLDSDGWLHTGDIGQYDDKGYFYIVDRVKELIKYKGFQIAPAELEALLLSHEQVADVAIIGVPDDEAGEVPKAFIVAKAPSGTETAAIDAVALEQALYTFVAERVAPYKKLRALEMVDTIPKSPSGKILRRVLIDQERAKRA